MFDNLCWALEKFCGCDVRGEVTDWIAGDVAKLSVHAHCWELTGGRMATCNTNISGAQVKVSNTWSGLAANQHAAAMYQWGPALTDQADGYQELGTALRDLAKEAVNTAQLVVDSIRLAIDLIMSAWAIQYIPVYGQAKFIQKAWNAYKTVSKAIAGLKALLSVIRFTKSLITVMIDSLTPTIVPSKPMSI